MMFCSGNVKSPAGSGTLVLRVLKMFIVRLAAMQLQTAFSTVSDLRIAFNICSPALREVLAKQGLWRIKHKKTVRTSCRKNNQGKGMMRARIQEVSVYILKGYQF